MSRQRRRPGPAARPPVPSGRPRPSAALGGQRDRRRSGRRPGRRPSPAAKLIRTHQVRHRHRAGVMPRHGRDLGGRTHVVLSRQRRRGPRPGRRRRRHRAGPGQGGWLARSGCGQRRISALTHQHEHRRRNRQRPGKQTLPGPPSAHYPDYAHSVRSSARWLRVVVVVQIRAAVGGAAVPEILDIGV